MSRAGPLSESVRSESHEGGPLSNRTAASSNDLAMPGTIWSECGGLHDYPNLRVRAFGCACANGAMDAMAEDVRLIAAAQTFANRSMCRNSSPTPANPGKVNLEPSIECSSNAMSVRRSRRRIYRGIRARLRLCRGSAWSCCGSLQMSQGQVSRPAPLPP